MDVNVLKLVNFMIELLPSRAYQVNINDNIACPNSTIGINGVCMQCPYNCIICQRDGFNR